MSPLLTPEQAAKELGIGVDTLAAMRKAGEIPYINIGRGRKRETPRYDLDDLIAWREKRKQTACQSASRPEHEDADVQLPASSYGGRPFSGNTGKTTRAKLKRRTGEKEQARSQALISSERVNPARPEPCNCRRLGGTRWRSTAATASVASGRSRWLLNHFGAATMLHDITPSRIAHMIAKRRGERSQRTKHREVRIGNATVNRTVIVPLREIIVRARDTWQVRVAKIKSGTSRLT